MRGSSRSRSRRSSASTRSNPRAWPTSTNGWRNISRCGPTRSKPWNIISMPGPPMRKRRERSDDEQALGRGRSVLARETNGGLKMDPQGSPHPHHGGRKDAPTPQSFRASTLTFEGDFATGTTAMGLVPGTHAFLARLEDELDGSPLVDWRIRVGEVRATSPGWGAR